MVVSCFRSKSRLIILTIILGIVAACSATESNISRTDDLAAIENFNLQYLQAINDSDIELLASLTTDEHVMIASGGEPLTGKKANIDAMIGAFQRFDIDETWIPFETQIEGDLAYQRGTFTVNAKPKDGGEEIHSTGNFLRIYKRQANGEWRMIRDMFNAS